MKPIIFNELKKYIKEEPIRYDVPGHKGNYFDNDFIDCFGKNIMNYDVNSMKRLDNLNYPKGVIKQSQLNIATLHGAKDSRFLINGTTQGIQTMILCSVKPGDKILVPVNIHKSVQSAIILSGAIPIYVDVEINQRYKIFTRLTLKEIKHALKKHPNIKAALLINPSYYGIAYEFQEIVTYLKSLNIIVLVDEAHGGSYYFLEKNITAMEAGADISCISYHKTLGSLTQTSLLLFNSDIVSINQLDEAYTMLNTTSPSYLLMANLEVTILDLFTNKQKKFENQVYRLQNYKQKINAIKGIKVLDVKDFQLLPEEFDHLRLVIDVSKLDISGFKVYDILRDEYNIQIELGEFNIILCIISIFDKMENLDILINSLKKISQKYYIIKEKNNKIDIKLSPQKNFLPLRNIFYALKELVFFEHSEGMILAQNVMLYPPGISLMLQGEIITKDFIEYIKELKKEGIIIYGLENDKVYVLKKED